MRWPFCRHQVMSATSLQRVHCSEFTAASSLQLHCSDKLLNEWAIKTSRYLVADTVVVIVQFVGFCVTNHEIVADEVNLLSIIHDHPRS